MLRPIREGWDAMKFVLTLIGLAALSLSPIAALPAFGETQKCLPGSDVHASGYCYTKNVPREVCLAFGPKCAPHPFKANGVDYCQYKHLPCDDQGGKADKKRTPPGKPDRFAVGIAKCDQAVAPGKRCKWDGTNCFEQGTGRYAQENWEPVPIAQCRGDSAQAFLDACVFWIRRGHVTTNCPTKERLAESPYEGARAHADLTAPRVATPTVPTPTPPAARTPTVPTPTPPTANAPNTCATVHPDARVDEIANTDQRRPRGTCSVRNLTAAQCAAMGNTHFKPDHGSGFTECFFQAAGRTPRVNTPAPRVASPLAECGPPGHGCPAGTKCHAQQCIPATAVDCKDGGYCARGSYCASGFACIRPSVPMVGECFANETPVDGGFCLPPGYVYCGGGRACKPGQQCGPGTCVGGPPATGPVCGPGRCYSHELCSNGACYNPRETKVCPSGRLCSVLSSCGETTCEPPGPRTARMQGIAPRPISR